MSDAASSRLDPAVAEAAAGLIAAIAERAREHGFDLGEPRARAGIALPLSDASGARVVLSVAASALCERAYAKGPELAYYYKTERGEPAGLVPLLESLRSLITTQAHSELAERLIEANLTPGTLREVTEPRLVAAGLKPGAIIGVSNDDQLEAMRRSVPAVELSTRPLSHGSVHDPERGSRRFAYLAQNARDAQRLREIGERLIDPRLPSTEQQALWLEEGALLGYPACCVAKYAESHRATQHVGHYQYVAEFPWGGRAADPLANFLAAWLYGLSFFCHVPCAPDCAATLAANRRLIEAVFDEPARRTLARILSTSFVIWPSGSALPFRLLAQTPGEVAAAQIGRPPRPDLLVASRRDRVVTTVSGADALRIEDGRLRQRTDRSWRPALEPDDPAAGPALFALFRG